MDYCAICGGVTTEDSECKHGCCHAACCDEADGCPDSFDR